MMKSLSPTEIILARTEAFAQADFGFIYDSYHSESNFRLQFPVREDYLRFGRESLSREFRIDQCTVIREDLAGEEARVIYLVSVQVGDVTERYAELTWLRREKGAWRYHRGQKMPEEALPSDPRVLDFADFDRLSPKLVI